MKRLTAFLICAAALLCFAVPAFAEAAVDTEDTPLPYSRMEYVSEHLVTLYDPGNSLTDEENDALFEELADSASFADIGVGVYIAKNEEYAYSQAFSEVYYSTLFGEDKDGVLLVIDGETRRCTFYADGRASYLLDRERAQEFTGAVKEYIAEGRPYDAVTAFAASVRFYAAAVAVSEDSGEVFIDGGEEASDEEQPGEPESGDITVSDGRYKMKVGSHYALLHDLDDSLTPDEEERLFDKIGLTVQSAGFSVCVLISDDIGSDKSDRKAIDYADVYYERECGVNTDGILLLINDDTKYDWISTSGRCESIFYDAKIDALFDKFYDYVKNGDYCEAGYRFCSAVETAAKGGNIGTGTAHGETSYYQEFYLDPGVLFFFVIFIAIGEACLIGGVVSRYALKPVKGAKGYMLKNTLHFTAISDVFVRTYVTRHSASSSHSGGGGGHHSSGHHSSGGGHHGGGGRHR